MFVLSCGLRRAGVVAMLTCLTSSLSAQIPEGYELLRLTDDQLYNHAPDINNKSDVAFSALVPDVQGNVFLFSGGIVRKVSGDTTYDLFPIINDVGDLVWYRCDLDDCVPYLVSSDGGDVVSRGSSVVLSAYDINNDGDVVFVHDDGESGRHICMYDGDQESVMQLSSGGLFNALPVMNDVGDVAWTGYDFGQDPWVGHIMLYRDGVVTQLASGPGFQNVDLNNEGVVVWSEGVSIIRWVAGVKEVLTKGVGAKINDMGDIAFIRGGELFNTFHLHTNGIEYEIPHGGMNATRVSINDSRELALRFSIGNEYDIFLLRRAGHKGDFNHDCVVDLYDYAIMTSCYTGAGKGPRGLLAECARADFDGDGDVDDGDLDGFQEALTGPSGLVGECVE